MFKLDWFRSFMCGRYGNDSLNRFLVLLSFVFTLISMFVKLRWVFYIAVVSLVIAYFRMFSRNLQKRYAENIRFLSYRERVLTFFHRRNTYSSSQPGFKIYRCPGCSQKIRVPKGKGKILISCPKCSAKFQKRT